MYLVLYPELDEVELLQLKKHITENIVERAKVLPICLYPIITNGKLSTNINIPNSTLVKRLAIIDIPVIPPSIILLGIKNISNPIAAKIEPNIINTTLLN